jgi:Uma2 family endonuclease
MQQNLPSTLDEFLRWEDAQEERHEFVDGVVSMLPGGTLRHSIIAANLIVSLTPHLDASGRIATSDARIVGHTRSRYADVLATRDPRDHPDGTFVSHPFLIVEVLSESSAATDRGDKFDEYRKIETLEEYVLVDSRRRWTQTFRRAGNDWIASIPLQEGTLRVASMGCDIPFDAIYARTEL